MSPRTSDLPPAERAREFCLSALERRPHTRRELEIKLRQRGLDPGDTAPVLDRLQEVGLVDDAAFARAYVESRQRRRPRGRRALESELARRGVSRDIAAAVLDELLEDEDPAELAERALAPRLATLRRADPERARRTAAQFLLRRGFDHSVARAVVERTFDAPEEP